jgi:Ca-activated chloride channel family protein
MGATARLLASMALLALVVCSCSPAETTATTTTTSTTTTGSPTSTGAPSTTTAEPGPTTTGPSTGTVTLDFPAEVGAATGFEVEWAGEALPLDWVAIAEQGSAPSSWLSYFYTSGESPGELVAPVEAGDYVIRFVENATDEVLLELPITVTEVIVSLEAPDQVEPGASFDVEWAGPDGPTDYITIVAAGAQEGSYLDWAYTTEGNPLSILAPTEPGDYEVRYVSGSNVTLGSVPIEVG